MSISLYYTARRKRALTTDEQQAIDSLCASYSIRTQVERYSKTRKGHNGEDFWVYDRNKPTEPEIIFEGATKLPDNSEESLWELLQHWCKLLSELRLKLKDAKWRVHLDDHEIQWDDDKHEFDPTA